MAVRDRVEKYRKCGGGADLIRVEVLVPAERRADIVNHAARLRADERARKARLSALCEAALARYRTRVLDNIDLEKLPDIPDRAAVIDNALLERTDTRDRKRKPL